MLGQIYWVHWCLILDLKTFKYGQHRQKKFGVINPNLQELYFETYDVFHY